MATPHTPFSRLLSGLLTSFHTISLSTAGTTTSLTHAPKSPLIQLRKLARPPPQSRSFSSTPAMGILPNKRRHTKDPRVTLIRYHLQHPLTPRPLRLSRMRALRHWTIHRAWMLARRKKVEAEELELQRMYQSMHNACEELRTMGPEGTKDAGRLYRVAMEKKGIFGKGSVPIEYARLQTDTPAREPWNHGWTR